MKSVFECYNTYFSNKSMKSYARKCIALVRYCNQFLHAKRVRVELVYFTFVDCNLTENFSELKFLFIIMHANQDSKGSSYSNMHTSDSWYRIKY